MPQEYEIWQQIHTAHPTVHAITNPVTINAVVNAMLASGAAAICADDPQEVEEIVSNCQGLLLNIGMPDDRRKKAMLLAGQAANQKGIPVVLDPVGAGASSYRTAFVREILDNVQVTCIRGNMSEMAALAGIAFRTAGVEDAGVELSQEEMQRLAAHFHTTLAITGETDYAVNAENVLESDTGIPLLKSVTGTGCMLSGLVACALAAEAENGQTENTLKIVHNMLEAYGAIAEAADDEMVYQEHIGSATFGQTLIDKISEQSGVWRKRRLFEGLFDA